MTMILLSLKVHICASSEENEVPESHLWERTDIFFSTEASENTVNKLRIRQLQVKLIKYF